MAGPRQDTPHDLEATLAAEMEAYAREQPTPPDGEARVPVEAIADPALLAMVTTRARPEIMRQHALPTWAGELPHHLDPERWGAGFLAVHEGGPPPDVREAMREAAPQAHLRDLFRPIFSEAPIALELHPLPLDPGGRAAYAEVRAALVREPPPRIVRSLELLEQRRRAWRTFVDAPWQPFLRDDQPRREVFVAIEPSLSA